MSKRKRRHSKRRARTYRRNPIKMGRRRFRRNPIESGTSFVNGSLIPAAIGAAGAVGTDIILGNMHMIPGSWRQGMGLPIMRIIASLGVGWLVGSLYNERAGSEAAAGGIVVTLYSMLRPWAQRNVPFRMARYAPVGAMRRGQRVGRYASMGSLPRAATTSANQGRRRGMGMKGMGAGAPRRRVRRMGAFTSPARQGGMTPALMRYAATN